jgi:quinol monooxygenase YgiN
MAAEVQANEPGCHAYYVNRSNDNPDYFLIYEQYDDEAALEVHRQAAHFKAIVEGRVVPLLEKREREFYSLVA